MKLKIDKSEFMRILSEGRLFAGKSRVMPICDCVRVTSKSGYVRISSSDTTNFIQSYGAYAEGDEMDFCINAKDFVSYISLISDNQVCMDFDEEKLMLSIKHTNGKTKFVVEKSDEFPRIPRFDPTASVTLPSSFFGRWLSVASAFAQKTSAGSVMEGIHICADSDYIRVYGSQHSQIFVGMTPNTAGLDDFGLTILPTGIDVLSRVIQQRETVTLSYNDSRLIVKSSDFALSTSLLDLKYPNVHRLLRAIGTECFSVKTESLAMAVKRIKTQYCDGFSSLHLSSNKNSLSLSYSVLSQYGKQVSEDVPVDGDALGDVDININALSNILSACSTPYLKVYHVDNARQPVFFESEIGDSKEIYAVMPVV